ncbi:hypothetical protein TNCV_1115721 [Trichonephila clavipes]|nr:hypothetical protein TNCV_1115721 [Trichonephila clavipes]
MNGSSKTFSRVGLEQLYSREHGTFTRVTVEESFIRVEKNVHINISILKKVTDTDPIYIKEFIQKCLSATTSYNKFFP